MTYSRNKGELHSPFRSAPNPLSAAQKGYPILVKPFCLARFHQQLHLFFIQRLDFSKPHANTGRLGGLGHSFPPKTGGNEYNTVQDGWEYALVIALLAQAPPCADELCPLGAPPLTYLKTPATSSARFFGWSEP